MAVPQSSSESWQIGHFRGCTDTAGWFGCPIAIEQFAKVPSSPETGTQSRAAIRSFLKRQDRVAVAAVTNDDRMATWFYEAASSAPVDAKVGEALAEIVAKRLEAGKNDHEWIPFLGALLSLSGAQDDGPRIVSFSRTGRQLLSVLAMYPNEKETLLVFNDVWRDVRLSEENRNILLSYVQADRWSRLPAFLEQLPLETSFKERLAKMIEH